MSPEYKVALLGLVFSLLALPFLVAAWRSRQLRTNDDAMYAVVNGDDSPQAALVARVSPARGRLAGIALAAALIVVAGMLVLTVTKSLGPTAPLAPPVQSGPSIHP